METTLGSLLCCEKWYWDSNHESYIRFYEDGTGEESTHSDQPRIGGIKANS